MDCCSPSSRNINGLNAFFDDGNARSDARRFEKKGLEKRARLLANKLKGMGIVDSTVLEVGPGVGGLLIELLRAGAARGLGLELSNASRAAAVELAQKLGLADRLDYRPENIAAEGDAVPSADVVIMDRVICCYPHMPELVGQAAAHARRVLALTFPRDEWYVQVFQFLGNLFGRLMGWEYRFYLHPPRQITATVEAAGLRRVFHQYQGVWNVAIYQRA